MSSQEQLLEIAKVTEAMMRKLNDIEHAVEWLIGHLQASQRARAQEVNAAIDRMTV